MLGSKPAVTLNILKAREQRPLSATVALRRKRVNEQMNGL